jgi:hypothetical protein
MRWSMLSAVRLACLVLCVLCCVCPAKAAAPDIAKMTAQADVIVVGGRPEEVHVVFATGKIGGVGSYEIAAQRFIKGADSGQLQPRRAPRPMVSIDVWSFHSRAEWPVMPEPTGSGDRFIYFLTEKRTGSPVSPRQAPISRDAWFVPATSEAVGQVEKALPQASVWANPSDGLAAGVRTVNAVYAPGGRVMIELYVKNTSDHSILVPQQRLWANDWNPFLQFSGKTGDASSYSSDDLIVFLEKPAGHGQKDAMPPVELQPRQVYSERIDLASWQWTSSDGLQPFRPGMILKMHGALVVKELDKDFLYSKEQMDAMWRGRLEIPDFDICITSDTAKVQPHPSPK